MRIAACIRAVVRSADERVPQVSRSQHDPLFRCRIRPQRIRGRPLPFSAALENASPDSRPSRSIGSSTKTAGAGENHR
jgi:hypothetical protein